MIAVQHNSTVLTDVCPDTEIFVLTFLVTNAADLVGFASNYLLLRKNINREQEIRERN